MVITDPISALHDSTVTPSIVIRWTPPPLGMNHVVELTLFPYLSPSLSPVLRYDPLLFKLIVSVPEGKTFEECVAKTEKALDEFKFEGPKVGVLYSFVLYLYYIHVSMNDAFGYLPSSKPRKKSVSTCTIYYNVDI